MKAVAFESQVVRVRRSQAIDPRGS